MFMLFNLTFYLNKPYVKQFEPDILSGIICITADTFSSVSGQKGVAL